MELALQQIVNMSTQEQYILLQEKIAIVIKYEIHELHTIKYASKMWLAI